MLRESPKNQTIPYTEKKVYNRTKSLKNTEGNTTTKEAIITTQTEPKQELRHTKTRTRVKEKKERGIITKYIGEETFYRKNEETGELESFTVQIIEKKTKHTSKGGWRRVYVEDLFEILTGLYSSGRKIEVVEFFLNNLDSESKFIYTQDYIAKKTGIAKMTISNTFKYLIENNFIVKKGTSYMLNGDYIKAFGSDAKNEILAIKYAEARKEYEAKQNEKTKTKENKKEKGLFDEQGYYASEAKDAESAENQVS